jgi:branched-chain amino acid transport system ATP-binding protein
MNSAAIMGSGSTLEVRGLGKSFGGIHAVKDISFDVRPGEIVGLIGPNGAGKTTCFNLITGFYSPSAGQVRYGGADVTGEKPFRMARRGIVRSFQKTNILKSLSVFENVLTGHYLEARQSLWQTFFPTRRVRQTEEAVRRSAEQIIETMGLAHRIDTPASVLSCVSFVCWRSRWHLRPSHRSSCSTSPQPGSTARRPAILATSSEHCRAAWPIRYSSWSTTWGL